MSIEERIYQTIARVMGISPSQVNDDSSPETIENWDSFNGLILADELESEFNVKFSMEEIEDVRKVADIKHHLKNHGIDVE